MSPLIKSFAKKIHCMEYEDSLQEFYLSVIESLTYLNVTSTEAQIISYLNHAIKNKYFSLCKKNIPIKENECILNRDQIVLKEDDIDYTNLRIMVEEYNNKHKSLNSYVLYLFLIKGLSDKEISNCLQKSRQYINRIKKEQINIFINQNELIRS